MLDGEHPSVIPMALPSTIQAPSGPMTRARARAIQSEVTSLLLEFSSPSSETWLFLKSEMQCVIRYNAQATEPRAEEEEIGVNSLDIPEPPARARNFRPPEPPADPELPASDDPGEPGRANSLVSPEPGPDLPAAGTFGLPGPSGPQPRSHCANSLASPDPCPEPPAPGTSGPTQNFRPCLRAATWVEARVPFRPVNYIYSSPTYVLGLAK